MTENQDSNLSEKPNNEKPEDPNGETPNLPALNGEVIEKIPDELKKVFDSVSLQAAAFSGPVFNPILKKITEDHIHKVLDQTEEDSKREFNDRKSARRFNLLYAVLAAILFVFVTVYLAGQDKELYRDILTKIIIFFGGAGAGYGFKAYRDRE